MKFDKIKITDINPAEYNPRIISETDYNKLENNLEKFGLVDPIIINLRNNRIIGGHQRYDVYLNKYLQDDKDYEDLNLIKLGDIGWVFTDKKLKLETEEEEQALNLALNKISGEWDNTKLDSLVQEISKFDISKIGFDTSTIEEIQFNSSEANTELYSEGSAKLKTAENATFVIGNLKKFVPYDDYIIWVNELEAEADEKNIEPVNLILERLGLKGDTL